MSASDPADSRRDDALTRLGLAAENAGVCAGGEWLQAQRSFISENPASAGAIARAGAGNRDDYEHVMSQAMIAADAWRRVPAPRRGELVRCIGESLRQHKERLGTLISMETGKIKAEGDGEVQEMIDMADFATGLARMLYGKTMHSERPQHRLYEQWHPLGVVGVVTAFNFPAAVWSWNALLAVVCGNAVVWKPSAKAPLTAIAIQHIVNAALREMGAPGVLSLFVTDDDALAQAFVEDPRVALVSFTGSSAVGKRVAQTVAGRMGRFLLECSGNNAVIVDETADLALAMRAVLFGAVGTAGQRCTTTRRLVVQAQIYEHFLERLGRAYAGVRVGDPLDSGILMGPLIDGAAVARFRGAVSELEKLGASIIHGGNVLPAAGYFVEPTLVHASHEWPLVQRETFAPILYAMRYDTIEDAIAMQNAVPQGLSSSLFTRDLRHAELFLSACGSDCGIANINVGTSGAEIGGAFGGEKETGGGREAGSDAWQAYMRRQTNTINWGADLPLAQGIQFAAGE